MAAQDVGIEKGQVTSKMLISDHLTPKMQKVCKNAKSFKTRLVFHFAGPKMEPFSFANQKIGSL